MEIFVLVLAYVLAGVRFVKRDFRQLHGLRPAYARRPTLGGILLVVLIWFPVSVWRAVDGREWGAGISMWIFFAVLVIGGFALL